MRNIIDKLKMIDGTLVAKDKSGKPRSLFKKQGDLDGACATYSVVMVLHILGLIYESDTRVYSEPKDKATRKLIKTFLCDYGMHHYGQTYVKIKKMLLSSFSSKVDCVRRDVCGADSVSIIEQTINNNLPIIISIEASQYGHAMVAVGYERTEDSISKILCLDPSGVQPKGKRWNAEIALNTNRNSKYPYDYKNNADNSTTNVMLQDVLIISNAI